MKVFIGWSGAVSRQVAELLRDWLPKVIQVLEPWMSKEDIDAGKKWGPEVAKNLEEAKFGILCMTPENLESTWIHFEAGALSKVVDESLVCPYLYDLPPTDMVDPLAQFQWKKAEPDGTRQLLRTINKALGDARLPDARLEDSLEKWMPEFEEGIAKISATPAST
ncbi:MAG: toll/interleukin-1 receptor domain-containing protein, partial [Planctomycetes bacterium]|nr:toll/interleukin-1 receptor domain-containing protein [Planctomycetota bacterium]